MKSRNEQRFLDTLAKAENGSVFAQFDLAMMYIKGVGVSPDIQKIEHWLLKAAQAGHVGAQTTLAQLYDGTLKIVGLSHEQNKIWQNLQSPQKSVEWYQKAADHDPIAQYKLATKYSLGWGVERDMEKAVMLLVQLERRGEPKARPALDGFFAEGVSLYKEGKHSEALEILEPLADIAHRGDAQFALAKLYEENADTDMAIKYYLKAAEQGYEGAQEALDDLQEREGRPRKGVSLGM